MASEKTNCTVMHGRTALSEQSHRVGFRVAHQINGNERTPLCVCERGKDSRLAREFHCKFHHVSAVSEEDRTMMYGVVDRSSSIGLFINFDGIDSKTGEPKFASMTLPSVYGNNSQTREGENVFGSRLPGMQANSPLRRH